MIVRNETNAPLRVPLGRGKVLHLGPKESGHVLEPATKRAPFIKMLERGDISVRSENEAPDAGTDGRNEEGDGQQPSIKQRKGLA